MLLIAAVDFSSPMLWAVLIGWILSVVLHEFAHGLVAHLGGDYTIAERGGLSLNPLQYVDPFTSLILPAAILLIGGIPLPGGATYIRTDLLRSRLWVSAVSLAGPAMNLLLMGLLAIPLLAGWVEIPSDPRDASNLTVFLSAMLVTQGLAVIINLLPFPPLDGFGAIAPLFGQELQEKARQPQVALFGLIFVLVILRATGLVSNFLIFLRDTLERIGLSSEQAVTVVLSFRQALYGAS